jgi:hypothetical protein
MGAGFKEKNMTTKEMPLSPDQVWARVTKEDIKPQSGGFEASGLKGTAPTPSAKVMIDGFLTTIANDIFKATGDNDAADRADALAYLLGADLYEKATMQAKCDGFDDPAIYIRQYIIRDARGTAADRAMEEKLKQGEALPKRRPVDDDPTSPDNMDISDYLSTENLGALRGLAKTYGTTNIAALRIVLRAGLKPALAPVMTPRLKRHREHGVHPEVNA